MRYIGFIALFLLTAITACEEPGSYSELSDDSREKLAEAAGTVARYAVLHPCDSLRPEQPSAVDVREIMESCEPDPEAWAYFYGCVADTISKLEPPDPSCQQTEIGGYSEEEIGNSDTR